LSFMLRLAADCRHAISRGQFLEFKRAFLTQFFASSAGGPSVS
jgi:queuine/archaeosine tRNA-ribosyltransferase